MSVPRARLLQLMKVRCPSLFILPPQPFNLLTQPSIQAQCEVFSTAYNPEGVRTGNKILRQRLRGPALAAYYPRRVVTLRDLRKELGQEFMIEDEAEEDRLLKIEEYETLSYLASCSGALLASSPGSYRSLTTSIGSRLVGRVPRRRRRVQHRHQVCFVVATTILACSASCSLSNKATPT